jgi:hypothetical protein
MQSDFADPDHKLTNIDPLLKRIWLKEFEIEPILNYDMLDYLLENKSTYPEQLTRMLSVLQKESDMVKPFLFGYYRSRKSFPTFFNELAVQWPGFFRFAYKTAKFPDEIRRDLLDDIITYVDIESIKNFEDGKQLIQVLENDNDLLWRAGSAIGAEKLISLITTFGLRFRNLHPHPELPDLFNVILDHNAYELNKDMVETILRLKWPAAPDNLEEMLRTENYTVILSSGVEELIGYVASDINTYVEQLLLLNPDNTKESEQTMILMLNNEHLKDENKISLIEKQECRVSEIEEVPEVFHKDLLRQNKALPTWHNVEAYFKHTNAIDETLSAYLSIKENAMDLTAAGEVPSDPDNPSTQSDLETALLQANSISFDAYSELLISVDTSHGQYDQLDTSMLAQNRVDQLIARQKIVFSDWNWTNLKAHHPYAHIALAEMYQEKFMETISAVLLEPHEYTLLLRSDKFTKEQRFSIAETIRPAELTPELSVELLNFYYKQRKTLPPDLTGSVFKNLEQLELKIRYLCLEITSLAPDLFVELLDSLGEPYNQLAHTEKSSLFFNEANIELVTMLKFHGFIQSFSHRGNEIKIKGAIG